jgi:GH25 family lysozyme M1 (1,4-beta-N-acetylmuramidase)
MRAVGPDISKYQAPQDLSKPHGIDFKKMHEVSDFIFVRAGYAGSAGGAWADERVYEYMADLEPILMQNPLPFTFYWYFRDDINVMDQANRFSEVVNMFKGVINLPLVVDAEVFVKSDEVSTQKIIDFQTEVENQTGLKVDILYARAWQLNEETTPGLPEVLPYLFVARYPGSSVDPQETEPWGNPGDSPNIEPEDYEDWTFWQHTESADEGKYGVIVGATGIDESVFNGDVEQLREFANLHEPPKDEPIDFALTHAEQHDKNVDGSREFVFSQDTTFKPKHLTVQFPKGSMSKFTVKVVVDGVRVLLRRRHLSQYNDWSLYTFAEVLKIKPGDSVIATLEGDGDAMVKFVYETWF